MLCAISNITKSYIRNIKKEYYEKIGLSVVYRRVLIDQILQLRSTIPDEILTQFKLMPKPRSVLYFLLGRRNYAKEKEKNLHSNLNTYVLFFIFNNKLVKLLLLN